MGQSARSPNRQPAEATVGLNLHVFPTNLGWFAILGVEQRLVAVFIGHTSEAEVRRAVARYLTETGRSTLPLDRDWHPKLRHRLQQYTLGARVDFDDIDVELPALSDFQRQVIRATRRIRYGKTLSYGELAAKAGFPRAARAVGTVMKSNRFPIVIPCHRVVASGGKTGGYTSPQGVSLKLRLLALEAEG
jgi:methylated-DNA-[protein]-cysteine S-methyltransferase